MFLRCFGRKKNFRVPCKNFTKKIFSLRFAVSQRGCLVYKALVCCRSLYNFRQHFTVHFVMLNILWTYYLPRYVRLIELKMKTFSKKWKRFHFDLLARTDGHRLEPMKFYFENFHKSKWKRFQKNENVFILPKITDGSAPVDIWAPLSQNENVFI